MVIDHSTVSLLDSVLGTPANRKLFSKIADLRIADADKLKSEDPDADLSALKDANLIGLGKTGAQYYVTARGLKVARDLSKLETR